VLRTSVALTTSTRSRPRLSSSLPVACGLAADAGAGAMAADPGVGCELDPAVGAEPGVGELVDDPAGAGEVELIPLGESVGVLVESVGVGLADGDPLADGGPDGIPVGEPGGEQLGVPVGCPVPPGLPLD
jgi:hypothetical protein